MRPGTTRRGLLADVTSLAGTASLASLAGVSGLAGRSRAGNGRAVGDATAVDWGFGPATAVDDRDFDPAVHGFGFRNWSTRGEAYAEHDHEAVDEEQVRRLLGRRWATPARRTLGVDVLRLPGGVLDAIATQVYVSVNQQSGTNGHCYGMVFAAQQFYENPGSVPLGRESASEFVHPDAPVDDPDVAPVGREIDRYHLTQFLNLRAWLGRRAMVRPRWIDYERQLNRVTAAVDEFGTAGITVFDAATRASHQVLVYDYRRGPDATELLVYDPNYPARQYAATDDPPKVVVDTRGGRPTVRPYNDAYDGFVFNRHDHAIAARTAGNRTAGNRTAGSQDGSPAVAPTGADAREELFSLALFLVDSTAVSLTVVGPDGRPLRRDDATHADRTRSEYGRMRYRYGFSPGRYAVRVVGEADAEYALRAVIADADGERLDARRSTAIRAGEVHSYVADVPGTGAGSLDRDAGGSSWPSTVGAVGLGAGVAGVAGGAYVRLRNGSRKRSGGPDD